MADNVSQAYDPSWNQDSFHAEVEAHVEEASSQFSKTLNIAIIGKVSSGKSSLINALLRRKRTDLVARVGAEAGVTTKLKVWELDEHVRLIDSPGLADVRAETSQITKEFLQYIDVGILVVTGASDANQKKYLDDLRKSCSSVFVVLNKIDEWDKLATSSLTKVVEQWKQDLEIEKIYRVCTFGYDPETNPSVQLDVRGVDELRKDIEIFLEKSGKDILLARHMGEKQSYAIKIISGALLAVSTQVFLPGSAVFIASTQATAITSLYYLYEGKALSAKAAVALLPYFTTESILSNAFLWVQSFIPPTLVLEAVAATTAAITTLAMLATVNYLLASGAKLEEKKRLQETFRKYKQEATKDILNVDVKNLNKSDFWQEIIKNFLTGQAVSQS
ncbi:MAG TPA: GTP-binding protein [Cyanobacteria bacterium UBA8553]|nr:GTP-binding protein [Cyanobacteria bacterium UBA8553]HAJ60167.1 GTP-binding protein [Cyanobacteria bacterium UBA8543]